MATSVMIQLPLQCSVGSSIYAKSCAWVDFTINQLGNQASRKRFRCKIHRFNGLLGPDLDYHNNTLDLPEQWGLIYCDYDYLSTKARTINSESTYKQPLQ